MKTVQAIGATRFEGTDIDHAPCIKAGDWVFLNGIEATDYRNGIDPSVRGHADLPLHGLPRHRREGDFIARRQRELLAQAGTDFAHSVRLDQYYPTWKAVDPYHLARKAAFGEYIPPSTSVIVEGLAIEASDISVSQLAVMPGGNRAPQRLAPPKVTSPTWSGFAPAVTSGDFVFIAGQMARGADHAPDPRAHVPAHSYWGGYEIRKQAEYIIVDKLKPALEAAGSSPANAVKAQAYLTHIEDAPHFLDVWNAHFGDRQCALSVVPASALGLVDGTLEINLIALVNAGKTKKQIFDTAIPDEMTFGASAVRAGDLLFFSGLQAATADGLAPGVVAGRAIPHFGASARAQISFILEHVEKLCAAAGTSLANLARVHQFHSDLNDFYATYQVWRERLGGKPVPFALVRVREPLPVPGCSIIIDPWVYIPGAA